MWCIPFIKTLVSLKTSFLKKFKFKKKKQTNKRGVTFHSLLVETHSLLVTCCKTTRYSLQNSLVTRCKKSLVTRCKICSLLVAEIACCKNHSLLIAKFARCKKSLVTCCRNRSLLVAKNHSLLVAKNHSLLVAKFTR